MIPKKPNIIKTEYFILRPLLLSDAAAILKHINDRIIFRNLLTVPYPYTLNRIRDELKYTLNKARRKNRTVISFAIEIDGDCTGIISIQDINEHKAEISYWIGRQYRGKGIMTKVVKEVTIFGFSQLNLNRMYAHTLPFNKASMRVLEKAGFRLEAILKKSILKNGKLVDEYLFGKVI